jgi:hypothetical protein
MIGFGPLRTDGPLEVRLPARSRLSEGKFRIDRNCSAVAFLTLTSVSAIKTPL